MTTNLQNNSLTTNDKYNTYIYERYRNLKNSGKQNFDNNDLWKIFEYYGSIKLTEQYKTQFYEYDDIDPSEKEKNSMSRNDTGIDASNLIDTIVQFKLRKYSLTWTDVSTFFGSNIIFDDKLQKTALKWNKLIIARNNCKLSSALKEKNKLFVDETYDTNDMINYCENLLRNPPLYIIQQNNTIQLRDYQNECISLIANSNKNMVICLPTGTGKNILIINSLLPNSKYLILVPRIILMEQLYSEIIKYKPLFKNKIQLIGDNKNTFNNNKHVTICVFNSVALVKIGKFNKIFIDEAHHIDKPLIYSNDDDLVYDDLVDESDNYDSDLIESYNFDEEDNNAIEQITNDDKSDELINTGEYINIIKTLSQQKNNVYLSATIDKINDFDFYKKDIRDMISQGYLCDYTIHIPIFTNDPTNKNICEYLLKNYSNIIIYCNTQTEGKKINTILNDLQKGSSEYIDCNTTTKIRDKIINEYKNGNVPFLVNVRILVEGFDAPITKGVCFLHLPSSKTTIIQIIGRALRLHPNKTYANVILPFSSKDDEKSIVNFMKIIANNDSRIKKSFDNKKLGGYISIDSTDCVVDDDIKFKYEFIYDSMGILQNGEQIWMGHFANLKEYININNKLPIQFDKNRKRPFLHTWFHHQKQNFETKSQIMKIDKIYNLWREFMTDDKYKKYFLSNVDKWKNIFNILKEYITVNKELPAKYDANAEVRQLNRWVKQQKYMYIQKIKIMKNKIVYGIWDTFINSPEYSKYFILNEDKWKHKLIELNQYIITNKRLPPSRGESLGIWVKKQKEKYKLANTTGIINNKDKHLAWKQFIDKHKEYFMEDGKLSSKLEKIKTFIDSFKNECSTLTTVGRWINAVETNILENMSDTEKLLIKWTNENIEKIHSYGRWIQNMNNNYINKSGIMTNEMTYDMWTEFRDSDIFTSHFISEDDKWDIIATQVKLYVLKYEKLPAGDSKDKTIAKLGNWIWKQKANKNKIDKFNKFLQDNNITHYFLSGDQSWKSQLNDVIQYIEINGKIPHREGNFKPPNEQIVYDPNVKLSENEIKLFACKGGTDNHSIQYRKRLRGWIDTQNKNYNSQLQSMAKEELHKLWTEFLLSYPKLFKIKPTPFVVK
jgi:superfamily II DNA or RNA helicase